MLFIMALVTKSSQLSPPYFRSKASAIACLPSFEQNGSDIPLKFSSTFIPFSTFWPLEFFTPSTIISQSDIIIHFFSPIASPIRQITHKKARKLHRTYFQKAGSGITFENKIDTHYLACMHSLIGDKYKSGWSIVSYTHSQNFPDFAFWDTSTNCLQPFGCLPEQSAANIRRI